MSDWTSPKAIAENWDQVAQILPIALLRPKSELVRALRRDHDDLRELAAALKGDGTLAQKRATFRKFKALLKSHSLAEEKAVYDLCLEYKELRQDTFEGYTEHQVCDDLLKRIAAIRKPDKWQGAVKVLAELVQHHVDEEERDLFPELERAIPLQRRIEAESRFLDLRDETQDYGPASGVVADLPR